MEPTPIRRRFGARAVAYFSGGGARWGSEITAGSEAASDGAGARRMVTGPEGVVVNSMRPFSVGTPADSSVA